MKLHTEIFFQKKYGGRGASGRRGDRPTTCTVLEASQERVRYASAPGCPGHGRASLALTDLHTHHSTDAALRRSKQRLRYKYDAQPPRATGDLPGIHVWPRLTRRIDAGGPLAGPPALRGGCHAALRRERETSSSGPYGGGEIFERTRDYPRLLPVDRLHICSQGNAFLIF